MNNKKGQTLILFIIFLPVILLSFALIVDVGLMYNAKIKGENMIKEAQKENIDIKKYFKDNNIELISIKEEKTCTKVHFKINSVFGSIIGKTNYEIEADNC